MEKNVKITIIDATIEMIIDRFELINIYDDYSEYILLKSRLNYSDTVSLGEYINKRLNVAKKIEYSLNNIDSIINEIKDSKDVNHLTREKINLLIDVKNNIHKITNVEKFKKFDEDIKYLLNLYNDANNYDKVNRDPLKYIDIKGFINDKVNHYRHSDLIRKELEINIYKVKRTIGVEIERSKDVKKKIRTEINILDMKLFPVRL